MISGYWSIKRSIHGLFNLFAIVVFYLVNGLLLRLLIYDNNISYKETLAILLPFSNGGYWFVTSYFCLYILAPYINIMLDQIPKNEFKMYLFYLCFLLFWMGNVWKTNYSDGKGFLNFLLAYSIGYYIRWHIDDKFIRKYKLDTMFPFISISFCYIVLLVITPPNIGKFINHFVFEYNSPGIYIYSILFILFFKSINLQSKMVNRLAISSFSIYLLHECPLTRFWYDYLDNYFPNFDYDILKIVLLVILAIVIFSISIFVDNLRIILFKWVRINYLGNYIEIIYKKLG